MYINIINVKKRSLSNGYTQSSFITTVLVAFHVLILVFNI